MLQQAFRFDPVELPPAARAMRREVRGFLGEARPIPRRITARASGVM